MTEIITDVITNNCSDTESAAGRFAEMLESEAETAGKNKNQFFAFIAMYGDLGAGKTAFVRGLASVLTPGADVRSPSYTIVNEYQGGDFMISHFDVYRIHDDDDLYSVGFYDYFPSESEFESLGLVGQKKKSTVMAVEWCENIPFALPDLYYEVRIEKCPGDENSRRIVIGKTDRSQDRK